MALPMPGDPVIQLKNGLVLISGGGIATDDDCCCCDFTIVMSYSVGQISVSVISTTGSVGLTRHDLRIYRNGVLVYSENNRTGSGTFTVSVSNGQTVTATATASGNPACSATATCTREGYSNPGVCEYWDFTGKTNGSCYTSGEIDSCRLPASSVRTVTVSGLTGPMAALNGTYSVDCLAPGAGNTVSWSGGGYLYNFGSVGLSWGSQHGYTASCSCLQSNTDSCVSIGNICQPVDASRRSGFKRSQRLTVENFFNCDLKLATCGSCVANAFNAAWYTPGSLVNTQSSNGSPAESAIFTWS